MPKHPAKRKFQREPVLASLLAPVIVWLAARFGFHVGADTATWFAGVLLAAAAWYARSKVTPTDAPDLRWLEKRIRVKVNGRDVPPGPAAKVREVNREKGNDR